MYGIRGARILSIFAAMKIFDLNFRIESLKRRKWMNLHRSFHGADSSACVYIPLDHFQPSWHIHWELKVDQNLEFPQFEFVEIQIVYWTKRCQTCTRESGYLQRQNSKMFNRFWHTKLRKMSGEISRFWLEIHTYTNFYVRNWPKYIWTKVVKLGQKIGFKLNKNGQNWPILGQKSDAK